MAYNTFLIMVGVILEHDSQLIEHISKKKKIRKEIKTKNISDFKFVGP